MVWSTEMLENIFQIGVISKSWLYTLYPGKQGIFTKIFSKNLSDDFKVDSIQLNLSAEAVKIVNQHSILISFNIKIFPIKKVTAL